MPGSIKVTSQVGVGTVFVITIPFEIAQEQEEDEEIAETYDIHGIQKTLQKFKTKRDVENREK